MSRVRRPLAARFLSVCAGPEWADSIEGDLREQYGRVGLERQGWSWGAVLPIAMRLGSDRLTRAARSLGRRVALATSPRGNGMIQGFWRDVRFSLRSMRRAPIFTFAAAATLSLGIDSSTVLYSFVEAFIFRPLPFAEPGELVHVWSTNRVRGDDMLRSSLPEYRAWKSQATTLSDIALFNYTAANVTEFGEPERLQIGAVSANAFDLLGRQPILGRAFVAGEDAPGAARVAMLSHGLWESRFGADPDILGKTIALDEHQHEIVGVMPADFAFPLNTTLLWKPYSLDEARYDRDYKGFQVVARLAPDTTASQAQAELDAIAGRLGAEYPDSNKDRGISVVPLRQALSFVAEILDPMAALLAAAVVFVPLITCANVASLLLSRAAARERELAVRAAIGAGRGRMIRQLLTESAVLALLGVVVGLPLAQLVLGWMDATIPLDLYRVGAISLDAGGMMVAVGVSLAAALGFGVLPAFHVTRASLVASLREGGRGSGHGARLARTHGVLAVAQIGTAFVLLICAALVARSLDGMKDVPLGFETDALAGTVVLTTERYQEADAKRAFQRQVLEELRSRPSVEAASIVSYLPLNHETSMRGYLPAEVAPTGDAPPPRAIELTAAPGYFETMGISLLQGRDFSEADDASAPPAVIVNKALAEATWSDGPAIGRSLRLYQGTKETLATVVGVVANARHMQLSDPPERILYIAQYQDPWRYMRVLVRSREGRRAAETDLREAIAVADPSLPISDVRSMERVARDFLIPQRMLANALLVLGGAALLLAVVGIYGVLAQQVAGRTQEIGVRMALGATRSSVLGLVLRRGLKLSAIGGAIGIAASLATARLLERFMFGLTATDATTMVGVALALGGTAVLACAIPAARAARIDPLEALHYE